jgi:hypothetical protein
MVLVDLHVVRVMGCTTPGSIGRLRFCFFLLAGINPGVKFDDSPARWVANLYPEILPFVTV